MKTYFTDIIPKIQNFSQKLDDLSLLTNQHWVIVDEKLKSKNIYIFRANNELLISQNGKVEKAKWEYLGNNSLLIDKSKESFLFKHGFFDENILALKIDGINEYAFLINENKYNGDLNSIENIVDFLNKKYIEPSLLNTIENKLGQSILNKENDFKYRTLKTDKGILEIKTHQRFDFAGGDEAFMNESPAPDGKYVFGWPSWLNSITIKNGRIR